MTDIRVVGPNRITRIQTTNGFIEPEFITNHNAYAGKIDAKDITWEDRDGSVKRIDDNDIGISMFDVKTKTLHTFKVSR